MRNFKYHHKLNLDHRKDEKVEVKENAEKKADTCSCSGIIVNDSLLVLPFWPMVLRKLKSALMFLAFRESKPKHRVAVDLTPMHVVLIYWFLFIAPMVTFGALINYGIIALFLGESALLLGFLETMHILFDR